MTQVLISLTQRSKNRQSLLWAEMENKERGPKNGGSEDISPLALLFGWFSSVPRGLLFGNVIKGNRSGNANIGESRN
jgi:hypothetical protein